MFNYLKFQYRTKDLVNLGFIFRTADRVGVFNKKHKQLFTSSLLVGGKDVRQDEQLQVWIMHIKI